MLLPDVVVLAILSFLTYNEVALLRVVSRRFNTICQVHLNKGFMKVKTISARVNCFFESKLPRRPSERYKHPLADFAFVASTINSG